MDPLIEALGWLLFSVGALVAGIAYAAGVLLPLVSDRYCDRRVAVLLSRHGERA